ncbi:MAG TPA: homoserine kinase [Nocardioidaceae bacterium]|nr:homoserine kinase [Nocardioidaceae bacterium]
MPNFVTGPVEVSVPATSANLGPGYDSLGLALDLRDVVTAEVVDSGLEIVVSGVGADEVPRDERHLVHRAMTSAFEAMGCPTPGVRLHCRNQIPHGRGLGSSSAAIVAGVCAARGLVAGGSLVMDDEAVFTLAAEIEGHPDNVAPALFGGFTIARAEDGGFHAATVAVDPRVQVVVFVPPDPVETKVARGLLPPVVPHADAAANAGRAALLVAALTRQPELLLPATEDYLHQRYRRPAMPDSLALVEELRADGVAAVVSGAGPTVLAFTDAASLPALARRVPRGWAVMTPPLDPRGAVVTVLDEITE